MQDNSSLHHKLHVGYSGKKRVVKLNDKALHSYKDLMDHFRVITVTEDDLGLIKLGPDMRRHFIDQAILLYSPGYLELLKEYKSVLDNRNRLLQQQYVNTDMYHIWTEQLWTKTVAIQAERELFLEHLSKSVDQMLASYFPYPIKITFTYRPKGTLCGSWHDFQVSMPKLFEQEKRFRRSLFGAHLDDIAIDFQGASSRIFASRGQQKLVTLLIKLAQLKALGEQKGPALFLLDDFMTDFDAERAEIALNALSALQGQLIFTAPVRSSLLGDMLANRGVQRIEIST
jgi:DNA replication and repair protein RecF